MACCPVPLPWQNGGASLSMSNRPFGGELQQLVDDLLAVLFVLLPGDVRGVHGAAYLPGLLLAEGQLKDFVERCIAVAGPVALLIDNPSLLDHGIKHDQGTAQLLVADVALTVDELVNHLTLQPLILLAPLLLAELYITLQQFLQLIQGPVHFLLATLFVEQLFGVRLLIHQFVQCVRLHGIIYCLY